MPTYSTGQNPKVVGGIYMLHMEEEVRLVLIMVALA